MLILKWRPHSPPRRPDKLIGMKLQFSAQTLMLTTAMVGVVCGAISAGGSHICFFSSIGAEMALLLSTRWYYFVYKPDHPVDALVGSRVRPRARVNDMENSASGWYTVEAAAVLADSG